MAVDHPQASVSAVDAASTSTVSSIVQHSTAGIQIKAADESPSTGAPRPQQIVLHQSKTASPAHAKIDRHHVDVHSGPITDLYMGTSMGGTLQGPGHLANGASKTRFTCTFSQSFPCYTLYVH